MLRKDRKDNIGVRMGLISPPLSNLLALGTGHASDAMWEEITGAYTAPLS